MLVSLNNQLPPSPYPIQQTLVFWMGLASALAAPKTHVSGAFLCYRFLDGIFKGLLGLSG